MGVRVRGDDDERCGELWVGAQSCGHLCPGLVRAMSMTLDCNGEVDMIADFRQGWYNRQVKRLEHAGRQHAGDGHVPGDRRARGGRRDGPAGLRARMHGGDERRQRDGQRQGRGGGETRRQHGDGEHAAHVRRDHPGAHGQR